MSKWRTEGLVIVGVRFVSGPRLYCTVHKRGEGSGALAMRRNAVTCQ